MDCRFENDLVLTPLAGGFNWRLDDYFIFDDELLGRIVIPKGFVTDLGSIPMEFQNIISNDGPATRAYVVHDYLYSVQEVNDKTIDRKDADMCLWRAMIVCGYDKVRRLIVYEAVRFGGEEAWNRKKIVNQ